VACGPPTSASGNTSCSLANGTYPFTISATGFVTQNVNVTVSGTTTAPTIQLVRIAPPPTYVVSVEVRSKNGTALSGASVSYSGPTSGTMPSTNATGGTSVTLGNGTYRFTASLTGFNTNSTNGTVDGNNLNIPITLTPTQTVPPPTYKLTFHVENSATGANLAGAWVNRTVSGKNVTCGSPTASSGYASCSLANGTYTFTISAIGFVPQTVTVTVSGTTVAPVVRLVPN
jgi:hypothetical protein